LRFNLSEAIAERNAFNCECERHDLLARKMQGHDVCFAAVTRLRTFIKAIECAAVVYGGHEPRAFAILKATPFSIDYTKQNFHQVLTQRKSQHMTLPQHHNTTFLLSEPIDTHECHQSNWFHLLIRALAEFYSIWCSKESA